MLILQLRVSATYLSIIYLHRLCLSPSVTQQKKNGNRAMDLLLQDRNVRIILVAESVLVSSFRQVDYITTVCINFVAP